MFFNQKKKHVLVIDDDRSLQRMIGIRLSQQGQLKVSAATCGQDGLRLAQTQQPDLILLDWVLPDIDGPDVLECLKCVDTTQNIPVIMLTGRNLLGDVEDAFERGADAYVTKPFSLEKLGQKVRRLLFQQ
ncbi:response regulator [Bacterioplanes sanyensis]|uniref:Response regulator n=1 Tax=Bacterioplanes sanyensis TaxID=1249553 RepID=A0A222FMR1_9GAMM|nr:response regulator [Bacterioplanes sanyensis]ASP39661.1 response regulator [Bacterioplanes sanyensis]